MKKYKDKETLEKLYSKYNSQKDVAEECDCSPGTISIWMDKFNIDATNTHSNVRDRDFTPIEHDPNTICEHCGSEFWRKPSLRDGKNFCDMGCYASWMSDNVVGEYHHQYDRITVTCANCGEEKDVTPSYDEKVENHFCDDDCRSEYIDMDGDSNPSWKGGKQLVTCENCGDEKKVYPYRLEENEYFFCDGNCRGQWVTENFSGKNHPLYSGYSEYYGSNWLAMRDKIRERDGGQCQLCGKTMEEMGKWPDVHHIRAIKEFDVPENANFPENMVCLCSHCHGNVENGNINIFESISPEDLRIEHDQ